VTNEWTNRQIGDRSLPVDKQILSEPPTTGRGFGFGPQTPPESGLLGDVTFVATRNP
jgi:hypothetical protein